MAEEQPDRLLTIADVASLFRRPERSVYRLLASGSSEGSKLGGGAWRFRWADFRTWIDAQVTIQGLGRGEEQSE